jgi:hypothetical protein
MAAFDEFAPNFLKAKDRWPDALLLSRHYEAVRESYVGSGLDVVGSAKSFVETVCRTLLGEFGRTEPNDKTTTYLVGQALKVLGLENVRGATKIDDVLNAHNKMADALGFIRSNFDPGAHGKDGFIDFLTASESRIYLLTADSLLGMLLGAYDGREPDILYTREPYERFAHLHNRLDRNVSVSASVDSEGDVETVVVKLRTPTLEDEIEIRLEPSRLLYENDRQVYLELLTSSIQPIAEAFEAQPTEETKEAIEAAITVETPAPAFQSGIAIVDAYNGALSSFKDRLDTQLQTLGGLEAALGAGGTSFRDSLLATAEKHVVLDWSERLPLRTAMKVALKKVFLRFAVESARAEQDAKALTGWFAIHVPAIPAQEATPA